MSVRPEVKVRRAGLTLWCNLSANFFLTPNFSSRWNQVKKTK